MFRRIALATAVLAPLTAVALAAPANADPLRAKNAQVIQLWCDNGSSYVAVVNGNGAWSVAHDLSSTSTLVPLAFGEQTFTITDAQGHVLDQQTEPARAKGSATKAGQNTQTSCEFAGSSTDPVSGNTFTISGTVRGFVTPVR